MALSGARTVHECTDAAINADSAVLLANLHDENSLGLNKFQKIQSKDM